MKPAGYVSNEPENAAAHAALALCLTSARRNEAVMKELNRAIDLEPDAANFYVERAQLLVEFGDDEKAIQDFSKAIEELKFESVSALRGRCAVYAQDGKFDNPIADFTRAINREPLAFYAPYMERGASYRQMNDLPKAMYEECIFKLRLRWMFRKTDHPAAPRIFIRIKGLSNPYLTFGPACSPGVICKFVKLGAFGALLSGIN